MITGMRSFMADAHGLIVQEVDRQAAGDLLRAPGVCPPPVLPRSTSTTFSGHRLAGNRNPAWSNDVASQSLLYIGLQCRVATARRSSTPAARADERPPAWCGLAREEARSSPAPQTRDTDRTAAWPIVQTSLVPCRLPAGTILFLQPATRRFRPQH